MTKKTESLTPILDDEDKYSDFRKVQQLWLERQPFYKQNTKTCNDVGIPVTKLTFENIDEEDRHRYYKERGEQVEIRTMAKWNAIPKDQQRDLISMVNNTIEALDSMMHVMYDLQRPIPESIRKIACKEFEW